MGTTAVLVSVGAGFTAATATLPSTANDTAGIVTFTAGSAVGSGPPYLIFTLTWSGSWCSTYSVQPAVQIFPCANAFSGRSAAFMAAVAALGPFFGIMSASLTHCDVYCTASPGTSGVVYDIGYHCLAGP